MYISSFFSLFLRLFLLFSPSFSFLRFSLSLHLLCLKISLLPVNQQFSRPKEEERTERTAVEEEESRKGGKQQSSGSSSVKESAVAEERSWKSPSVDPFEKERAEKAKEEGVDKESEDEKAAEEKEPSPSPPLEKDEEKTPEERVDQNEAEQSREQQTIGTIASTPSPFPSPTESPETTGTDAAEKETATARESGQVRFQTEALPKALSFRLPQPNDPFSARGIALVDGEPTAASQLLTHAFLSSSPSESDVASDNKQSVLLSHSLLFDFSDDLHVKVLEMNASIPFNIGERRVEAPSYFFLERDGAKRSDGGREEFQKRQVYPFYPQRRQNEALVFFSSIVSPAVDDAFCFGAVPFFVGRFLPYAALFSLPLYHFTFFIFLFVIPPPSFL